MGKHLTPQLRFPDFQDLWGYKKYNQIYTFYSTNSLSREKLNYENGEVKNIHYGDIHTKFATLFDIEKEKVPYVNSGVDLTKVKDENFCQEGDLLIADASEDYLDIGKTTEIINLNKEKLISGLHTFHARPNKHKMAIGFSGYLLQSWKVRKQVMTIAQGTKVLGLATSRLGKINLVIPQLPEQQKIASFLTDVDEEITKLTKKKTLLEQYKKGIMQKIFNQELRFKDDNGNAFPNWEEKKLGEVFKFKQGFQFGVSEQSETQFKGSVEFIRIINVTSDQNDKRYVLDPGEEHHINDEDLFMVRYGDAGRVANGFRGVIANNMFRLLPKQEVDNMFFFYSIGRLYNEIHSLSGSSTMPAISFTTIDKLKIKIPSIYEQTKIANFLSDIDLKIEALNTKKENSKAFKKGLLQQMFV